jgi:hypothetical protein
VKEGDFFGPGDELATIETDKATVSFEATDDGYVAKILIDEGTSDIDIGKQYTTIPPFAHIWSLGRRSNYDHCRRRGRSRRICGLQV